uniref:Eukaryotic translation initiation factor 2 subunit 1 n=1 Tax=Panagrellus redivivus TaxID=6233 RepID=A0A7E4UZI5_PANRE
MALSCRFYYNHLPDLEDTVMVKVTKIAEMGAYVTLSEYNNKEGMILLSELSRRRIRSVNRLIRVGRSECVVVVRVDQQKEYIDLSKRRVDDSGIAKCTERYAKAKAINSILRHVAGQLGYTTNEQLEDLYEKAVWHFDRKEKKKAAAYEIFKNALTDPTVFDECNLEPKVKEKLLEDIRKKLTPVAVKIRADFEVSCFAYEGVEAVKAALIEGKKQSTEQWPIKINLIAAPLFVITVQTMERDEGIEKVKIALEAIKQKIESFGGTFHIVLQPKVVTDVEEQERDQKLEEAEFSGEENEDDDGLVAPEGLNEEADAEEAKRGVVADDDESDD